MKETLLERLQREAREKYWTTIDGIDGKQINSVINNLIANTLKQAAEEVQEIIKEELQNAPLEVQMTKGIVFANVIKRIDVLTDAQRLLGEDNK